MKSFIKKRINFLFFFIKNFGDLKNYSYICIIKLKDMTNQLLKLTEEEFDNKFTLIKNHIDNNASFDGNMFETYGEELEFVKQMVKQNRVITIIESDEACEEDEDGFITPNMYYVSGMHHVNRIGYLITEQPFIFEFECLID